MVCYHHFILAKGRSQGFASASTNCAPYSDSLSLRLTDLKPLTSLVKCNSSVHYAKGTPSPHVRAPTACKRMVSGSISLPCSGCFSPFLHSTSSLSVSQEYLALADGAARFPQGVSDPAVLRILLGMQSMSCTGLSPYIVQLSRCFHFNYNSYSVVLQPQHCRNNDGLGCSPFARRY